MNIQDYRIEPADFRADYDDLRTVREAVFEVEQKIPADLEWDELDPQSIHVIARDELHRPIGTGRLTPERNIGRMAVLQPWRHQGVGKALLHALIEQARKRGWAEVGANAQVPVMGFYEKFGFIKEGGTFMEAGIPHQAMRLQLEPKNQAARPLPRRHKPSMKATEFGTFDDTLSATLTLISEARRRLCIYSADLEYDLYGRIEVVSALKQFAVQSRDGAALIIVQDTKAVRSKPHPLLELVQRLPSTFQFRMPVKPEDFQYPSAFLVNDCGGYLFRQFGNRYQGNWSPAQSGRNRQLTEEFDRFWQRFLPCTEFRSLSL